MGNSPRQKLNDNRHEADKYPHRKVRLINSDWTIYVVPKNYPQLFGKWGRGWGVTDFDHKTVYITNHLSERNFKWSLTHELLHAFMYELGYHTMLLKKIRTKKNEEMVDGLAKVLYPLVKNSVFKIQNYQTKGWERE